MKDRATGTRRRWRMGQFASGQGERAPRFLAGSWSDPLLIVSMTEVDWPVISLSDGSTKAQG